MECSLGYLSSRKKTGRVCCLIIVSLAWAGWMASFSSVAEETAKEAAWISLFNGKNMEGWTPKFRGCPLGENFNDTFRVEDGVLKVCYDKYDEFNGRFGHLFYKDKFAHYRLRVEYRFVGEQVKGGAGWAWRNNGVMVHSQDPKSMEVNQEFPVSIEVQLLGGDGTNPRTTANLCSPGTNVVMNDTLIRQHCYDSTSETYHGDVWVTVEIEVRGNKRIRHLIDGKTVLEYSEPQLDDKDANARRLMDSGAPIMIEEGFIALQAESHPTEFRKIELLPLEEGAPLP